VTHQQHPHPFVSGGTATTVELGSVIEAELDNS